MLKSSTTNLLSIAAILIAGFSFFVNAQPAKPALGKGYSLATGVGVFDPAAPNGPAAANANTNVFNYQGVLRKSDGTLASGTFTMTFGLYSLPAGNNPLAYSEEIPGVVVRDGIFNVLLGDKVGIADSIIAQPQLYLGVRVHPDTEMAPRQRIHAVPRALIAHNAYSANTLAPNATVNGGVNVNGGLRLTGGGNLQGGGILIQNPSWTGVEVQNTPWDGFHVNGSRASGYAALSTGYSGFYSYSSGEHGLLVQQAADTGVVVDDVANNGVSVSSYGGHGVVVWTPSRNPNNYAGWFGGRVVINGRIYSAANAVFAQNSGDTDLVEGDIVTIKGIGQSEFQTEPVIQITRAKPGDSIFGVIESRAETTQEITPMSSGKPSEKHTMLRTTAGLAKKGDFVTVVISGVAKVKVNIGSTTTASPGMRLSLRSNEVASIVNDSISDGSDTIAQTQSVVGLFLAVDDKTPGMVWAYIRP